MNGRTAIQMAKIKAIDIHKQRQRSRTNRLLAAGLPPTCGAGCPLAFLAAKVASSLSGHLNLPDPIKVAPRLGRLAHQQPLNCPPGGLAGVGCVRQPAAPQLARPGIFHIGLQCPSAGTRLCFTFNLQSQQPPLVSNPAYTLLPRAPLLVQAIERECQSACVEQGRPASRRLHGGRQGWPSLSDPRRTQVLPPGDMAALLLLLLGLIVAPLG